MRRDGMIQGEKSRTFTGFAPISAYYYYKLFIRPICRNTIFCYYSFKFNDTEFLFKDYHFHTVIPVYRHAYSIFLTYDVVIPNIQMLPFPSTQQVQPF